MNRDFAETVTFCRLMASARSWLNRARGVRQARTPLKKMREVLHSGQRLGTNLREVEDLRADIRRREWEEAAKRVKLTHSFCVNFHSDGIAPCSESPAFNEQ